MEAFKQLSRISGLLVMMVVSSGALAQEYDDLYFTSKDRKTVKEEPKVENKSASTYQSYTNNTYTDNYSAHEVNPEYIARYQASKDYGTDSDYVDQVDDNATYSEPSYSNISYYPESYVDDQPGTTVINNYYSNSAGYGNGWNNRGWNSGASLWYDPWFGWNTGFNISFGYGNGWGGYYSPWYNSWGYPGYAGGFYDPWYGWSSPYYGGWGWSRWNRYNYAYTSGFYHGLYHGGYYSDNGYVSPRGRDVVVGSRYSRGGTVASGTRTNSRVNAPSSASGRADVSTADRRDYSRTQNEYFSRSRAGVSGTNVSNSSATSSRSRVTTVTNGNSRSTQPTYSSRSGNSNSGGTLRNSGSTSGTRRYNSAAASSSNSNSSYSRSRSSGSSSSSSYSSGSTRSRSSSSYTPSRSSSSSSRSSFSGSSSSGSSRSSSGGSSSGRSSGGGSSSSRSRGGGR